MEIVTIANKKGGIGKTTTAFNFAAGLTVRGKKVLAIDLDSQTNFSDTANPDMDAIGIYEVLCDGEDINDAIQNGKYFDFISASRALTAAAKQLPDIGTELTLKKALKKLDGSKYDYLVIDTPPNVAELTCNALVATDTVIIPTNVEKYSLDGMIQLYEAVDKIRETYDKEIKIDGVLLTMYEKTLNNTKSLLPAFEGVAENLGTSLYETKIRKNVKLSEAQTAKKSIFDYLPESAGAEDYGNFVNEFLNKREG